MRRRFGIALAGALLAASPATAWADAVGIRASSETGMGRLSFDWPALVGFRAGVEESRLRIVFNRPIEADLSTALAALPQYLSDGRIEKDGRTVVFDLARKVTLLSFRYGDSVTFHLIPSEAGGTAALAAGPSRPETPPAPPTPPAPAGLPEILVRSGVHPDRNRLVFDWPGQVAYEVEHRGESVRIAFGQRAQADLSSIGRMRLPNVRSAEQSMGDGGLEVRLAVPAGIRVRDFRNGNSVVVDLYDPPKAAAEPPGTAADPKPVPEQKPDEENGAAPTAEAPAAETGGTTMASRVGAPIRLAPPPEAAAPPPPPPPPSPSQSQPTAAAAGASDPGSTVAPAQTDRPAILADPGQASSAAVFVRAGFLHLLFDRPVPADALRIQASGAHIGAPEPLPMGEGAGYRLDIPDGLEPRVRRDGTQWVVSLEPPTSEPPPSLPVEGDPDFLLGARAVVHTGMAGRVLSFTDPAVGDRLHAVLLSEAGKAVTRRHDFLQARILPAAQGIVVRPVDDTVVVRPIRDGFELTADGGLLLSPAGDAVPVQETGPLAPMPGTAGADSGRLFDLEGWRRGGIADFNAVRQQLQRAVIEAPEADRDRARLDLARFYLANGNGAEALGLLGLVEESRPELADQPEFRALRGAARVLAADHAAAREDLAASRIGEGTEARLWRAAADAGLGDWPAAARGFEAAGDLLNDYPMPAFRHLALQAAWAAIETGRPGDASRVIDRIEARLPQGDRLAATRYLRGRIHAAAGRVDEALEAWRTVAKGSDRYYRTRAEFDMANLELDQGRITPEEAIERLERLRFAWRGDAFEFGVLRRLGEIYFASGKYALGFDTLRTALALYPDSPQAPPVARQVARTFADLFLKDGAADLPALDALALYDEFRDLVPKGEDGDAIARKLAERLVEIDLLDRAADILSAQVDGSLEGVLKARVGARLASIRLLDGKPAEAIEALDRSAVAGLPAELATQHLVLRARALADRRRFDEALALLAPETGRLADLLRVDIAWRGKRWAEAAEALARVIDPPPAAGEALPPEQSQLVLNRAVALALAGDAAGLERLREEFGAAMATGPDGNGFRVLTRTGQGGGLIDPASIRARVEEVDVFKGFLASYRSDGQSGETD